MPIKDFANKGLSHVAFATGDLEATIRFWRDLLGLRLVLSLGRQGDRQYFFQIADRQYLGFFEWPGVQPIEEKDPGYPARGPFAFDHVALVLDNEDALWRAKDRLEAAGLWVTEVVDHGFVISIYTFDPNGISVELCIDTELDLGARPQLLDRQPGAAAREGCEPQPDQWPEPTQETPVSERRHHPGFGSEISRSYHAPANGPDDDDHD